MGHFKPPQTPFWAHVGQNCVLAVSLATWPKSQIRAHFSLVPPPPRPLVVSTHQNGPNTVRPDIGRSQA